jgi:drug/metabolite transporter superfamily protein YnfA
MSASLITRSLSLFILAGLCEIGGGWLGWQWIREGRPWSWGLLGGLVLCLYGVVPTLQPAHFSRLCSLRQVFHCAVTFVGLDFRQQPAG